MIKKITVEDDGVLKEYDVVDGLGIFICDNGDQFVVSQMSENQSIQLAMLKAIIKE